MDSASSNIVSMTNQGGEGGSKKEASLRVNVLSAMGTIFLIAFWSCYNSFPGLISSSGLEPVGRIMPFATPSIHRNLIATNRIDADSFCELAALLGMLVSCIVASGWMQHGLLFVIMTSVYSVLTRAGGTFYSFQWDTLLAEAGTLTALCYTPWARLRPQGSSSSCTTLGAWPLRFLLFKLMYMSGVVKIQSECPTWRNLTALEYHFATQCLPAPLAWHFHQLHPFLLRFSVAATLWIEIPGAVLLLLTPFAQVVRIGVVLQILLQIVIILTGNYNFFNLLTIVLCLACLELDASKQSRKAIALERIATCMFFVLSFPRMFEMKRVPLQDWWYDLSISLKLSKADCDALSEALLPGVIVACLLYVLWEGMKCFQRTTNMAPRFTVLIHTLVCFVAIGVTALPLCSLTRSLQQDSLWGLKRFFVPVYRRFQPYRVVNGYGLFRHMTGVGPLGGDGGWAGQPPSIVHRPEIILEGLFDGEEQWAELSFRWKPGNEYRMPQQVAPHQPRLDWQMWFAALGTPQANPWFLNLIVKLLDGCAVVQNLVGDPELRGRNLVKIRAKLYHYDFTRLDTDWNRAIPGTEFANTTSIFVLPEKYWYRRFARYYLAEIGNDDRLLGLKKQLVAHGYTQSCQHGTKNQCAQSRNGWCNVAFLMRKYNLYLLPLLFLFGSLAHGAVQASGLRVRKKYEKPLVSREKKNQ